MDKNTENLLLLIDIAMAIGMAGVIMHCDKSEIDNFFDALLIKLSKSYGKEKTKIAIEAYRKNALELAESCE